MVNVHTQGIAKGSASPNQYAEAGYAAGQNFIKLMLTVLIIVVICVVIWKIYQAINAGANAAGTIAEQMIVQQQTGVTPARQTQIKTIAEEAHAAIWSEKTSWYNPIGWFNSGYSGVTENEEAFISALNRLQTVAEVSLFNTYYKNIAGHSARADMNEYLNASEIARITNVIRVNLN